MTLTHRPDRPRAADRAQASAASTTARSAIRPLALLFAVVLVGLGGAHVVGALLLDISVVDLGTEQSVGTWVTSGLHALCAAVSATAALLARRRDSRWERNWWLLTAAFAAMSVDEVAAVHDRLRDPVRDALNADGVFLYAWVIPALALTAVFVVLQLRFLAALDRATRRGLVVAGAAFVAAAAGMEMAEGWLASDGRRGSSLYELFIMVEELMEMGAVMLAACVLLRHLVETYGRPRLTFVPSHG